MDTKKEVLAKLLPLDTEIVKDNGYWSPTTIWDELPNPKWKFYIADLEEMPKMDAAWQIIDFIGEHMNDHCEDRLDRYEDTLESLKCAIQVVYDNRREWLSKSGLNKVYKMETRVVFEHELESEKSLEK